MTTKTREDLVLESLEKLGVLPSGQTAQIEDTTRVDEALDAILEELAATMDNFSLPDTNNIPLSQFMSLAQIVAFECVEKVGITGDEAALLEKRSEDAKTKLRIMLRGRPTGEPLRTLYF